jgi:protein-S-isoprenylcysteine O-methyltransferase Ste14
LILRHLLSILLLPVTVTVVVPALLLGDPPGGASLPGRAAGVLVGVLGLLLVGSTIRQFATRGHGTLAPWDPPEKLVVSGIYRRVRNPMITGVVLLLCAESLFFRSLVLAGWMAVVFALNALYIPWVEEPGLVRRFGAAYEEYRAHVPRWIPRLTPWDPPHSSPRWRIPGA